MPEAGEQELPPGWVRKQRRDGKAYYEETSTNQISYDAPQFYARVPEPEPEPELGLGLGLGHPRVELGGVIRDLVGACFFVVCLPVPPLFAHPARRQLLLASFWHPCDERRPVAPYAIQALPWNTCTQVVRSR